MRFGTAPPLPVIPEKLHWRAVVMIGTCYAGPIDRGEHVLGPLGMDETGWSVAEADLDRLAALYVRGPDGALMANTALGEEGTRPPLLLPLPPLLKRDLCGCRWNIDIAA